MRHVLFGTDWWTDCDDVVALRMAARAHRLGLIHLDAIGVNGCMEHSAASVQALLCDEDVEDVPIGIDHAATDFGRKPLYQERLAKMPGAKLRNVDCVDAAKLYLDVLRQAEEPLEVVEIGYPQVLAALLQLPNGQELVCKKVKTLWMMAGKWDENPGLENNFCRNERSRRAASYLLEHWPTAICFLGWEVGFDVLTGGALAQDDPVHLALQDHGSPNGRSSWDPMLVYLFLCGDAQKAGYDLVKGLARVDQESGENRFIKGEEGPHAYVVRKKETEWYRKAIDELIACPVQEAVYWALVDR